jgi:acyl carrier protein
MSISIKDQVRAFIEQRFPVARARAVADNDPLLASGLLDSLSVLDVVAYVEATFGIGVTDEDLTPENFESIASMAAFVAAKRNGRGH